MEWKIHLIAEVSVPDTYATPKAVKDFLNKLSDTELGSAIFAFKDVTKVEET